MVQNRMKIFFAVLVSVIGCKAGYQCLSCNGIHDTDTCENVATCASDERCFGVSLMTGNGSRYLSLGCRADKDCWVEEPGGSLVGKRSRDRRADNNTLLCNHCCEGNFCNQALCGHRVSTTLAPPLTPLVGTDPCLSTPCLHGSCVPAPGGGYSCNCGPWWTGSNCEQLVFPGDLCDFQRNMCHWHMSESSTLEWVRNKGPTPSAGTGPLADHRNISSNFYIYLEASDNSLQVGKMESAEFPGGEYCLDFYLFMYGQDMGSLSLNVLSGSYNMNVKSWRGDQGPVWLHKRLDIFVHADRIFNFEFEGKIGQGYRGDIAIDDISILPGKC
ncbi:MAM and LDL-receptor class A domain-containing protein 1-like [Mya arenaria]|uniref:MAM and LDL-receptor class A domain-containing protein 1-like n=1 Tax=Mya arenaria TaxID=6604 RepID=UPI0022DF1485|nr:MAM and LDL-receptor class A domain-containing protein 1-like [Mya arenaria]